MADTVLASGCPFQSPESNHIAVPMHTKVSALALETLDYNTGTGRRHPVPTGMLLGGFAVEVLIVGIGFGLGGVNNTILVMWRAVQRIEFQNGIR